MLPKIINEIFVMIYEIEKLLLGFFQKTIDNIEQNLIVEIKIMSNNACYKYISKNAKSILDNYGEWELSQYVKNVQDITKNEIQYIIESSQLNMNNINRFNVR